MEFPGLRDLGDGEQGRESEITVRGRARAQSMTVGGKRPVSRR